MTDRPIIFSAPMVRALLDGRKTQTRRIIKPYGPAPFPGIKLGNQPVPDGLIHAAIPAVFGGFIAGPSFLPRYAVGDRLWVREAVCWVSAHGWKYRADNEDLSDFRAQGEVSKWAPSIHMTRHASRLTLIVSAVRVQRLQEISEEDARAEGVGVDEVAQLYCGDMPAVRSVATGTLCSDHRDAMREIWAKIHGPGAWAENPWVAAISFTVHRQNIDKMQEST